MPRELEIALRASHEERPCVGYEDEPCEVHVAAIYQIEGSGLEDEAV